MQEIHYSTVGTFLKFSQVVLESGEMEEEEERTCSGADPFSSVMFLSRSAWATECQPWLHTRLMYKALKKYRCLGPVLGDFDLIGLGIGITKQQRITALVPPMHGVLKLDLVSEPPGADHHH